MATERNRSGRLRLRIVSIPKLSSGYTRYREDPAQRKSRLELSPSESQNAAIGPNRRVQRDRLAAGSPDSDGDAASVSPDMKVPPRDTAGLWEGDIFDKELSDREIGRCARVK